jgi:hypothetical protein
MYIPMQTHFFDQGVHARDIPEDEACTTRRHLGIKWSYGTHNDETRERKVLDAVDESHMQLSGYQVCIEPSSNFLWIELKLCVKIASVLLK